MSPVVVVAKGQKGQGVAAAITKQGGERKRGQSRAVAWSSPVPVVGGRSEMIVAPAANATAALGSVGGKAISPPQFSAAAGKQGMSNGIALPPSLLLASPATFDTSRPRKAHPWVGIPPRTILLGAVQSQGCRPWRALRALLATAPESLVGEHCRSRRSLRRSR